MRRFILAAATLLLAISASASPFFLNREGVLWKGSAAPEGLLLTGEREGQELVHTTIPFALAVWGARDKGIQVAADEVTGKVVVVWQRDWSDRYSEIMLAVWQNGAWQEIVHLSDDLSAHPRYPAIQLSDVTTDGVQDSFLHIVWWEGGDADQHGTYSLLRLTAGLDEPDALLRSNLDYFIFRGLSCNLAAPSEVVEHPLFVSQPARDRALIFFASNRICLFHLLEVRFTLDTSPSGSGSGLGAVAQRRRHTPVFGVRKVYQMPEDISLEGARVVMGNDLHPVAYRVEGGTLEYVVATDDSSWSPKRELPFKDGLTVDQAIPLLENLAR